MDHSAAAAYIRGTTCGKADKGITQPPIVRHRIPRQRPSRDDNSVTAMQQDVLGKFSAALDITVTEADGLLIAIFPPENDDVV
jgi:hypothetical protein